MHPRIAPEHLRRVEQSVDELLADLRALTVELRALAGLAGLAGPPPALPGGAPAAAEHLRGQAQFVAWECAFLRGQLARLRATGRLEEDGAGLLVPGARPV